MNELMRSRGMRRAIAAACSAVLACAGLTLISVAPASATAPTVHDRVLSQNFSASGTFTYPAGVTSVTYTVVGEQGYSACGGTGGNPAKITGALDNVGGGAQLGIRVASGVLSSAGGQPGGGDGGNDNDPCWNGYGGGGGGGYSGIFSATSGFDQSNALIIAGGGGGASDSVRAQTEAARRLTQLRMLAVR